MYTCFMSQSFCINIKYVTACTHVSCHIHSTLTSHLISFLSLIILIISGSRYNLWSHTSCSFLQFMKLYIMQFSPIYEAIHHAVFSNLWSYTSCSFLQFPISFSHKCLTTDQHQHCSQTQSTVYSQCHRTSVTPTFRKILK